jgi:hypothetical protein
MGPTHEVRHMSRTVTPRALARHFAPVPLRSVELPRNLAAHYMRLWHGFYHVFTMFYHYTSGRKGLVPNFSVSDLLWISWQNHYRHPLQVRVFGRSRVSMMPYQGQKRALTSQAAPPPKAKRLMVAGAPVKDVPIWTKRTACWNPNRNPNATGDMSSRIQKLCVVGIWADGKIPVAALAMIQKRVCGCLVVTGLGRIILVVGVQATSHTVPWKPPSLHAKMPSATGKAVPSSDWKRTELWVAQTLCQLTPHCHAHHVQCTMSPEVNMKSTRKFRLPDFGTKSPTFNTRGHQVFIILKCETPGPSIADGLLSYSGRTFSVGPWPLAWLPHSYLTRRMIGWNDVVMTWTGATRSRFLKQSWNTP